MKICTEKHKKSSIVEIELTVDELKLLSNFILKFQTEILDFQKNNESTEYHGYTHMHLQDVVPKSCKIDSDIVLYVKLDNNPLEQDAADGSMSS